MDGFNAKSKEIVEDYLTTPGNFISDEIRLFSYEQLVDDLKECDDVTGALFYAKTRQCIEEEAFDLATFQAAIRNLIVWRLLLIFMLSNICNELFWLFCLF
jgi:hypothetical protein